MREKYESLSLSVLRDLAKARGLRGISTLKKADLIQKMLLEDEKEKIYVPVSSSDSRLRLCLTKEEAWNLIKRIPDIPTAWTNNEKMREQNYKEAVRANNPEALVAIIKMIYQRKQKRLAQGKKCTATDARYFQIAENLLYMELGVALEKPKQEICKTIIDYINQNKID